MKIDPYANELARAVLQQKGVRDWKTRLIWDDRGVKDEFETQGLLGGYNRVKRISDGRIGALSLLMSNPIRVYWDNLGVFSGKDLPEPSTYYYMREDFNRRRLRKFQETGTPQRVEERLKELSFLWREREEGY